MNRSFWFCRLVIQIAGVGVITDLDLVFCKDSTIVLFRGNAKSITSGLHQGQQKFNYFDESSVSLLLPGQKSSVFQVTTFLLGQSGTNRMK